MTADRCLLPLEGRVAIVTGAGRGIGASLARALATAGADVVLAGRTQATLDAMGTELRALGRRVEVVPTDVRKLADADHLVAVALEAFGVIDVLVNNAGVGSPRPFLETTDDDWDAVFDTNLRGTFLVTRAVGRHLVERRAGKVINVASHFAFKGVPQMAAYCASKAALVSLTRTLALEWADANVQVNALAPGYFATDFNTDLREDRALYERVLKQIPAKRMGEPDELAALVVLLADPALRFMTGETIVIDGGQLAR